MADVRRDNLFVRRVQYPGALRRKKGVEPDCDTL